MSNVFARWGRMAAGAVALALLVGWTTSARADFAYAYSLQTFSGLRISGTATNSITGTTTTASNTLTGFGGNSLSDPTNTAQAYNGIPGTPATDLYAASKFVTTFAPAGSPLAAGAAPVTVTPAAGGPVPVANFSRGDAAYTSGAVTAAALFGAGINVANVAEAYTSNATGTGNGGFLLTAAFTTGAGTPAVSVSYAFVNDLFASVLTTGSNTASAQAGFNFTFNIKNSAGVVVFDYAADSTVNAGFTNGTTGAPPNSPELLSVGFPTPVAATVAITGLLPSNTYSITFTGGESVNVNVTSAIPEPTSIIMLGLGLGGVGLVRFRNRRAAV